MIEHIGGNLFHVALRKESVDRNSIYLSCMKEVLPVALRKESVDRNFCHEVQANTFTGSLSARRAWIEILPDFEMYQL